VREERQMRYDVKILTSDEVTCRGSMIDCKVGQPHDSPCQNESPKSATSILQYQPTIGPGGKRTRSNTGSQDTTSDLTIRSIRSGGQCDHVNLTLSRSPVCSVSRCPLPVLRRSSDNPSLRCRLVPPDFALDNQIDGRFPQLKSL
jgi:hypothetical protein